MKINFIKKHNLLMPLETSDVDKIDSFKEGAIYCCEVKNMDLRTIQQNKSLHLWCEQIAKSLNNEKLFIQDVIKLNTKWDMIKVKEMLFKPVVKSLYTKDSTTKLNKDEFDLVINTLIRAMASKGITIPDFPNREKD